MDMCCGGVNIELTEEVEGVGDGARVDEEVRLLALGKTILSASSFDEAWTDRDLVLTMFLPVLLRLVRTSIDLFLFFFILPGPI